jgi:hypothetical protein
MTPLIRGFLSCLGLPAINLAIPLKNISNIFNKKGGYIEGLCGGVRHGRRRRAFALVVADVVNGHVDEKYS